MNELKVRILAKALSHRNTGDPMSIEEIADYALEQHKELISAAPANDSFMLARAEEHITKLTQELKNKTGELMAASEKAHYYRTMLMKILEL